MNSFHNIIKRICEELDIKLTFLSDNWTIVLEKNNQIHYITGYQFDLNNHALGNIMDDKGLFWELLKNKNIPIIEQHLIFNNYNKQEVLDYFINHDKEIVIKGNISNAGKEVFKVNKEENLFKIIDKLLTKQYSVSLCPYYHIRNEYRVIVINNTVKLVFGKIKPVIIGNGINTTKELAIEFNDYYINHEKELENPDYIPKIGEKIEIDFRFNLSKGAKSFVNISSDMKDMVTNLAIEVAKKLNIVFASIDIIYTEDNKLLVMEANSGVTLNNFILQNNGHNIAYTIYKEAIKLMFNINN